ncbi:MAG: biotin--[acetyl-CoA-carboxylase] ligase [Rhodospirillaceae bacterium]|nr:biotin--[acetyl-CoA-carboxylase] ligase [Rhodospirillaceae bacterium]|tara:strand:- start:883 stop:1680 length:798 start_codon:yes stop_codon:yes gene_type:complete
MPKPIIPSNFSIKYFNSVTSTNNTACLEADQGAAAGTVILAKSQTCGRGRYGRNWESPAGNLYASILLRPDCPVIVAAQTSLVTSIAVWETVSTFLPKNCEVLCKWPNDILVNQKKISGILLESQILKNDTSNPIIEWLIIGIGINISTYPRIKSNYKATSLSKECGFQLNVDKVLSLLLLNMEKMLNLWANKGMSPIIKLWISKTCPFGQALIVESPNGTISGKFNGLNKQGELKIITHNNLEKIISAGDVHFSSSRKDNASSN